MQLKQMLVTTVCVLFLSRRIERDSARVRQGTTVGLGRLPLAPKSRLEWNARHGTRLSRCGVSPSPSLSRLRKSNNKSKWRLHLLRRMAGKETELNRVEWEFTNCTGFFRSFRLEREKRYTSEDFHLFR